RTGVRRAGPRGPRRRRWWSMALLLPPGGLAGRAYDGSTGCSDAAGGRMRVLGLVGGTAASTLVRLGSVCERPKVQQSKCCVVHSHRGFKSHRYRHVMKAPTPNAVSGLAPSSHLWHGDLGGARSTSDGSHWRASTATRS